MTWAFIMRTPSLLTSALVASTLLFTDAASAAPAQTQRTQSTTVTKAEPDATALVRAALQRIGGDEWPTIKSFESIATVKSAMGDARIEYRFVAPDARQLVQVMPGGRGVMEMGCVNGVAWMGEPGRARAIDPKVAQELAGGGDLQSLVHALDARFGSFVTHGKTAVNGRECWTISMTPKPTAGAPASAVAAWTLYLDTSNATILGLDIPAPPKDANNAAPEPSPQLIRFSDWQSVEGPMGKAPSSEPRSAARAILSFRIATVESGGMKTELLYTRCAVNTLEVGAIAAPAKIDPAPPTR